jgi:AcrR family transcriptional regulator
MPKMKLDRTAVVAAAARIANADGLEALTLNRLAGALGIRPPSLYNHIRGLADLRRELALLSNRALGQRLAAAALARSGPEALLALAGAYRAYIKEFPGQYAASLPSSGARPAPDPELSASEEGVLQVVLAVVASFGLTGPDALHAARGLRSLVHGFATLEAAGGFGLPLDCDESFRRLVAMLKMGLTATI